MNQKRTYALVAGLVILAAVVIWGVRSRHRAEPAPEVALLSRSKVYDVVPVAPREQRAEIMLNGEWDLAEAKREIPPDKLDVGGLIWKRVQLPATIQ
jgi:hypothetical protein